MLAGTGIRTYACPMVQSGHWYTTNGRDHLYEWYEEKGFENLERSLEMIDDAIAHPSGRLHGMVGPAQADTCTEEMFRRCRDAAEARGIPLQTHAAQSVMEHREMIRRHGKTPIEWLDDIGALGPGTLLGHAINIDRHPWVNHHEHKDLERLARSGATVVHCPRAFAQWGDMMRSLGGYRAAGVNMALGTDCYPHDMVEEMRIAGLLSKVASGHVDLLTTDAVFETATLGAARALGREDLGRIAAGAKADLALVDLRHPLDAAGAGSAEVPGLFRRGRRHPRRLRGRRARGEGRRGAHDRSGRCARPPAGRTEASPRPHPGAGLGEARRRRHLALLPADRRNRDGLTASPVERPDRSRQPPVLMPGRPLRGARHARTH